VSSPPKPPAALLVRLTTMLAALWWGGVSALAFVAVPLLFAKLGNPALAGSVAALLFAVVSKLGVVAGLWLTWFYMKKMPLPLARLETGALVLVVLAVVAAVVQDTWVAQHIVTARATGGDLRLWHGLGSGLVLLQWLAATCALWALTGLSRQR
jgi:hypothetical protein